MTVSTAVVRATHLPVLDAEQQPRRRGRPPKGEPTRRRSKTAFNESVRPDDEMGSCLATGAIVANAERLLVCDEFLDELEASFGVESDGSFAIVGETLAGLFPGEFGEDEVQTARTRVAMLEHDRAERARMAARAKGGAPMGRRGWCRVHNVAAKLAN